MQKKNCIAAAKEVSGERSSWKKLTPKQKQDKLNSSIRSVGLVTVFVLLVKTLIINF